MEALSEKGGLKPIGPVHPSGKLEPSGKSGWSLVESQMELQINQGLCSAETYRRHFEDAGLMRSWEGYNAWKLEYPDKAVPPEINRITSLREDLRRAVDPKPGEDAKEPERRDLE